jgi:hypothetical protein
MNNTNPTNTLKKKQRWTQMLQKKIPVPVLLEKKVAKNL